MRYYLFIDESGDSNLINPDPHFNVFLLCGVIIDDRAYPILDSRFKELKMKYFDDDGIIFHYVKMRNRNGVFSIFQNEGIKNQFISDLHNIIDESDFTIIACLIDKNRYKERYPGRDSVYEESLEFLCERCVFCMRRKSSVDRLHIVLEKRSNPKQDVALKKYYKGIIENGTRFMKGHELAICHENLEFRRKSANINGLQLADICAYPIARKRLSPESQHPIYDIIEQKFYKHHSGALMGYGLKIFP
jgi:hypothetical protein